MLYEPVAGSFFAWKLSTLSPKLLRNILPKSFSLPEVTMINQTYQVRLLWSMAHQSRATDRQLRLSCVPAPPLAPFPAARTRRQRPCTSGRSPPLSSRLKVCQLRLTNRHALANHGPDLRSQDPAFPWPRMPWLGA